MKLNKDQTFPAQPHLDVWQKLKQFTDARIALGRTGCSVPTKALLEFQLSHAQAKDAVYQSLNIDHISDQLKQLGFETTHVESCANNKEIFLKRPDLGRQLSETSRQKLKNIQLTSNFEVCIVIGDGLSARAIEENAIPFVHQLHTYMKQENWTLAPISIATGSRVALGDEVAQIFNASMLIMLIGERPGLSSPDSMGIYYTWQAHVGSIDSERNCISNVRTAGLSIEIAAQRLFALMKKSKQIQRSGVALKDEHQIPVVEQHQKRQLFFRDSSND
ncbi:ethanolamine ammonia-lyase subunit EutC [Acinetobacter sp. 2JN-4]|uniref:ethanolamine ammonia-lyase subunit EutC n=1 Tax=Acinetobacter sp. 2JN-4 TaxID=2479844 RepID=UPI000EF9B985|nr:ethanolamine ammonia-lyase subunit EutC [Acinetobacter sp. 2JN-4]RLZ08176.1 ethanolamine ammonia-lyase subunit EutC [Acinetobacter sp. 2JN-4]